MSEEEWTITRFEDLGGCVRMHWRNLQGTGYIDTDYGVAEIVEAALQRANERITELEVDYSALRTNRDVHLQESIRLRAELEQVKGRLASKCACNFKGGKLVTDTAFAAECLYHQERSRAAAGLAAALELAHMAACEFETPCTPENCAITAALAAYQELQKENH